MPRTMHRRRSAAPAALIGVLVLSACTGESAVDTTTTLPSAVTTTEAPPRINDGVLTLGVFLPQTGPGAGLGVPMIEQVELAVDTINTAGGVLGSPVRTVIVDEGAGTGPGALLIDGVDAIVGPASSNVALSQLSQVVQPATGVVTCSPTAAARLLDDFPDNNFFYRTVPSDSMQMRAIARYTREQGVRSVAVGHLNDPYGRGLAADLTAQFESDNSPVALQASVPFSGDQEDLSPVVDELLAEGPGVVVVLGDADDGGRLLAALDAAPASASVRRFVINDPIRTARATIQGLSSSFRTRLTGIAPLATTVRESGPPGFFTAHAVDCVNLIALAAIDADSDDPDEIRDKMASVSSGGRLCTDFEGCIGLLLDEQLDINYEGFSGPVSLSNSAGDVTSGWFESFIFTEEGDETRSQTFTIGL